MKRYISIICMLVSLVFCQGAFGQEAKWYDGLPLVDVTPDGISINGDTKSALCFEHDGEFYVYLDSKLVVSQNDQYGIYRDSESSCFFSRSDKSVSTMDGFQLTSERIIGAQDDTCAVVRFKVQDAKSHKYLNLRFRRSFQKPAGELIDTTGLGFNGNKLTRNVNDTISKFTVIEPMFSVYQSLELNGEKLHELDTIIGYNDPERSDRIEIDFKPHWDKLSNGANTITVKVASLDESYGFTKVYSKDYTIVVQVDEEPDTFPWLWVIIGVAALLVGALGVVIGLNCSNKKKLLKRLSACKTKICNLQDDESVPCDVKEQLESHSQRVTAAIADLRGRKWLKKADRQECEKLVDEIEEYMKNLGQQQSDPDPQPAGPAPQPEGPAPQPVDPAPQPDQGPDQKPEPQPEPQPEPEPQPVSNDELLAKIKELEDKLSKADEDKQAALAEQKDKLDKEHEKAVKDLTEQLEQEHKDELQKQSENHAKELKEQEAKYLKALETQKNDYEKRLRDQEDEHRRQIEAIEEDCARRIYALTKELNEVKGKWQEDKKYVVKMYRAYEAGIGDMVESMKSNGDDVAPAYTEMLQIHSESVHSFQSFHDQFQAIMEKELTIAEMREELAKVFSVHIDYERSWINALCRLHAYSKVEKLAPMFGLYNEYKVDISELYVQFLALASILGFENIHVPELFVEEFHSSEAESDNTNLVLPNIYPNYVQALVSSTIYDIHTIGYTYDGTTRKPKVAYYV